MPTSKRTFLMATGAFAAFGASSLLLRRLVRADVGETPRPSAAAGDKTLARTPPGDLGPFYPVEAPLDTDFDLTRVRESGPRARGEPIEVSGRVLYRDGTPQANARLEIWQANDVGRYAHPGDTRKDAPLDPNFQGYADIRADASGNFRILTVKPGLYPVDGVFNRSPHIHFDIRGRERRLVTQMYFDDTDAKVLAQDKLLQHDMWGSTSPLPQAIFAKLQKERSTLEPSARRYEFDIVL
jgi:protocatechuate 3,4-dioxygenase beta subunit